MTQRCARFSRSLSTGIMLALACCLVSLFTPANGQAMTYPDLPSVVHPTPEPELPAEFDTYSPPVNGLSPAGSAPVFAEWTRTGGPDDTLVATGYRFSKQTGADQGKDTAFLIYGESNDDDAILAPAQIQRLDGDKVAITLAGTLPSSSMYLVWPRNSSGYGRPLAVNRTDAWWLGPNKAVRGQTISVFGRNLSKGNGTKSSWVYIKKNATTVERAQVTAVNPYKVDFIVPANLKDGQYEVWIHNGHGGHYGWSGPLTLTVATQHGWTGGRFNVKRFGAKGNGIADDQRAIYRTLQAAAKVPYSTVYFPAGTYMISKGFTPPSNVRLLGDGKTRTYLKFNAGFVPNEADGRRYAMFFNDSQNIRHNIEFKGMTLDANEHLKGNLTWPTLVFMLGDTDLRFTDMALRSMGANDAVGYFHQSTGLRFSGCDIYAGDSGVPGIFLGSSTQTLIDHCHFYGSNDLETFILEWGCRELCVTNNDAQDYDNTKETGWCSGRFLSGNGIWGSSRYTYIGNNTTHHLSVRPGCKEQNAGEQVMWEGNNVPIYQGSPIAATGNTVTFANLNGIPKSYFTAPDKTIVSGKHLIQYPAASHDYSGQEAVIVNGKGLGQHRRVVAEKNGVVTVSPPWNVVPDATSKVLLTFAVTNVVVYGNHFQAKDYASAPHATCASVGAQPYGNDWDFIVADNVMQHMTSGLSNWAMGQDRPVAIQPNYWMLFANNRIENPKLGIGQLIGFYNNPGVDPGVLNLGVIFRKNTIDHPTVKGITLANAVWTSAGKPMDMTVFEKNVVRDAHYAVDCNDQKLGNQLTNTLFYKNKFDRGTTALEGSTGINFAAGQTPALRQNVWTNYATKYVGDLPGAVLEVPTRMLDFSGITHGRPCTALLTLWNAGTDTLQWSASTDKPWLSLSHDTGAIADEHTCQHLCVVCDPALLTPGAYTGTITVTAGGQTKKVGVNFTVGK